MPMLRNARISLHKVKKLKKNQNLLVHRNVSTSSLFSLASSMVLLLTSLAHAILVSSPSYSLSSECSITSQSGSHPILWSLTSQWTTSLNPQMLYSLTAMSPTSSTRLKNTLSTKTGSSTSLSLVESEVLWSLISGLTTIASNKERVVAMDLWLESALVVSPPLWSILFSDWFPHVRPLEKKQLHMFVFLNIYKQSCQSCKVYACSNLLYAI